MEFRNLKKQYEVLRQKIDKNIFSVCENANFISGDEVKQLEKELADYVGMKHCISCANGTDALSLALMAFEIGEGDCVFIPDFTFFATAETVSFEGAVPIFVDVDRDTFNLCPKSLEAAIEATIKNTSLTPKAIIPVDLFGLCADYSSISKIAKKYNLKIIEDAAQGFGGSINGKIACSFGDIAATSFFPAKPLGCYGDGGAIFTDDDEIASRIRSLAVHGKSVYDKYENLLIGINSRLDTLQAAILLPKLEALKAYELIDVNKSADYYTQNLKGIVKTPVTPDGYYSSWAQYTLALKNEEERNALQGFLKGKNIPTMVYYPRTMSEQSAMAKELIHQPFECSVAKNLCKTSLSLPIGPYITAEEQDEVIKALKEFFKTRN